jgi:hypothetical protein
MAQDARTFLTIGLLGVAGYGFYEYTRYSHGISTLLGTAAGGATPANISQLESLLPFTRWVMLSWGVSQPSSPSEAGLFNALQNAIAGVVVMPPTQTPGTTPTMTAASAPTSVSSAPTTTPTTAGSAGGTASATSTVQQPTAADLQHVLAMPTANADQWNYAYKELMGAGIEQVGGFNFDQVYGAVLRDGTRSSGQLTAAGFLNAPSTMGFVAAHAVHGMRGMGAIAHFYTPIIRSSGSMIYASQHPSPYRQPSLNMSGFTQPTGFEMALLGRQTLRSNKLI